MRDVSSGVCLVVDVGVHSLYFFHGSAAWSYFILCMNISLCGLFIFDENAVTTPCPLKVMEYFVLFP